MIDLVDISVLPQLIAGLLQQGLTFHVWPKGDYWQIQVKGY